MKKRYLLILFLGLKVCQAQNLVYNGGFEQYSSCPASFNDFTPLSWFNPSIGSPDYFNKCTSFTALSIPSNNWGYQPSHGGTGYSGAIYYYGSDFREYIEDSLSATLKANGCYSFSMYVSLAEASHYTIGDIGVYFSDTAIKGFSSNLVLPFTPQLNYSGGLITDTLNWILFTATYTAHGGEKFIIIGNFKNNNNTTAQTNNFGFFQEAYFYMDDVSLVSCNLPPVSNFKSSDTLFCAYDCINFTDLSSNATSWIWYFDGATPSSSTEQNPQNICYLSSGSYDVKLVVSDGALNDSITFTKYINVKPVPPTPIISQHGDTLICSTDSSYSSYQWYADSILIQGATDSLFIITTDGNYNVKVENADGCSVAVGINIAGVSDVTNIKKMLVYPNPFTNSILIHSAHPSGAIILYDVTGKEIIRQKMAEHETEIHTEDFLPGFYFLRYSEEDKIVNYKLLKY